MPIKVLVLGGGGYFGFFFWGGGSADYIFMGARIFLNVSRHHKLSLLPFWHERLLSQQMGLWKGGGGAFYSGVFGVSRYKGHRARLGRESMVGHRRVSLFLRKLEKAVAVSGVCAGVPHKSSGKVPGTLLEKKSRIAKYYKF